MQSDASMKSLFTIYQKRLTNLSSNNKSLWLKRTLVGRFLDMDELDFVHQFSSKSLLEQLFFKTTKLPICKVLDPKEERSNKISAALQALKRMDTLVQEERGAEDLYLAYPFVTGKMLQERPLRAPLFFIPMILWKENNHWYLKRNGEMLLNESLVLALKHYQELELDIEIPENVDSFLAFFTELYGVFKNKEIPIAYNSELFESTIKRFLSYTKEDIQSLKEGELRIENAAVIGLFPQAGSFLYQDYDALPEVDFNTLFLNEGTKKLVKEWDYLSPLAIDASQEVVLKEVNEGHSLVVQGPPGSGKSQLITNLLLDFAAKGKRVLLVCQKRAALDTVFKRIADLGLGDFAALVHDFRADRRGLYQKIAGQISKVDEYKQDNLALDAIFLERHFKECCKRLEDVSSSLEQFKRALFDTNLVGISAKELYLLRAEIAQKPLEIYVKSDFQYTDIQPALAKVKTYQKLDALLSGTAAIWQKRKYGLHWKKKELEKVFEELGQLQAVFSSFQMSWDAWKSLLKRTKQTPVYSQGAEEALDRLKSIKEVEEEMANYAAYKVPALARNYVSSKLKWFWSQIVDPKARQLAGMFRTANLVPSEKSLVQLGKLISDSQFVQEQFSMHGVNNLHELLKVLQQKIHDNGLFKEWECVKTTYEASKKLEDEIENFLTHFRVFFQEDNFSDLPFSKRLREELSLYFEDFCYASELVHEASSFEKEILMVANIPALEASLLEKLIDKIEEECPILRMVSSKKLEILEEEIQELVERKARLSRDIVKIQLKDQTFKSLDKNRLGNTTTYRELEHQVSKKKRIWPIRKLITENVEAVFKLVPIWLAAPEMVSAVFPLEEKFDLVVFDEASQCFAEHGIPSMLRGKQVVVAGDSMQLQPYDLYRSRYEEAEEADYLTEIDSLLRLSEQFLKTHSLSGHYRSLYPELIHFSNQHFYNNKLQLIPSSKSFLRREPAIELFKIEGVWENQVNYMEAEALVEKVKALKQDFPNKSIGIITFNFPQSELIRNLLQEDKLVVKNIENVQGDEYDFVVFSMTYAPEISGKMANRFGSLNVQGGENRLNVALSRAIEKMFIFTSFSSDQLQVENSAHSGPKLLKGFLQYVEHLELNQSVPKKVQGKGWLKDKIEKNTADWQDVDLSFADLKLENSNTVLLTDDLLFQQSYSAKESFGYLPLQLKEKQWDYLRAWSRNYWQKGPIYLESLRSKE